jgi:flagellar motor switch protein FliN/FliY
MESTVHLSFLEGVPVSVEVELGRRTMRLADLIRLETGDVLQLAQTTGAPLDVYAAGALVARAEVLSRGTARTVRITEAGNVE